MIHHVELSMVRCLVYWWFAIQLSSCVQTCRITSHVSEYSPYIYTEIMALTGDMEVGIICKEHSYWLSIYSIGDTTTGTCCAEWLLYYPLPKTSISGKPYLDGCPLTVLLGLCQVPSIDFTVEGCNRFLLITVGTDSRLSA